jgi:acyl-CoA thioesterase-1
MDRVFSGRAWAWAGLLCAAACGTAAGPVAPTGAADVARGPGRILVLGDSLAVSPTASEGFPAELQRRIDAAGLPWTVTNAGVRGDTTSGGLRRAEMLLTDDVRVLVLALGSNDGLRGVPIVTIEENLTRIIESAKARGIHVLLCGLETLPTNGVDYLIGFHHLFPRLAVTHGLLLVPFLLSGVALVPELNGPDGFHPNAAGARRIADNVWPHLQPLLLPTGGRVAPD